MIRIALRNVLGNKARTGLAMLGLILGVVTIVALISITVGLKNTVTETLSGLTGIIVLEKDVGPPFFSFIDASHQQKIERIPGVKLVAPRIMQIAKNIEGVQGFSEGFGGATVIIGMVPSKEALTDKGPLPVPGTLIKGRPLKNSDKNSVIIGKTLAEDHKKFVGSKIEINDVKFKVVGIWETGNDQSQDDLAMPIETARELLDFEKDKVSAFYVELDDPRQGAKIAQRINFKLDDVEAITAEQFQEQILGFLSNIDAFLVVISGAATIIGGVGIINTMIMSVMERIKEFGVLRAVGWTKEDLIKLILTESAIIGFGGGFFGLVIGMVLVEVVKATLGFNMLVDLQLMAYALFFGASVGIIGGIYPAWKASNMDPLEAIRFE